MEIFGSFRRRFTSSSEFPAEGIATLSKSLVEGEETPQVTSWSVDYTVSSEQDDSVENKSRWEKELVSAEMKQIGYMCQEITIKHRASQFRIALLEQSARLEEVEDPLHDKETNAVLTKTPSPISEESAAKRTRTMSLLDEQIPLLLNKMRSNIEENEVLILGLRMKLELNEWEGPSGHSNGRETMDGTCSARTSTMGRRSTWQGESFGSYVGVPIKKDGSMVDYSNNGTGTSNSPSNSVDRNEKDSVGLGESPPVFYPGRILVTQQGAPPTHPLDRMRSLTLN